MRETDGGGRPPEEARTEIIELPRVEGGSESVVVDPKLEEDAGFAALQAAKAKEEKTRPAEIEAARQRAELAAEPSRRGRGSARKKEFFSYLEAEGPLRRALQARLGENFMSRQKSIADLRVARAQDEAGRALDAETQNILRFLERVRGKASDVNFGAAPGARDFVPVEVTISGVVFGPPLTFKEKLKGRFAPAIKPVQTRA